MTQERNRNIQVIDGAGNCTYSVFSAGEEAFNTLFPGEGQDIEYAEDFFDRAGEVEAERILKDLWDHPVHKPDVQGLHGTLFFGLAARKAQFPSKRECDVDPSAVNAAQRALYHAMKGDQG